MGVIDVLELIGGQLTDLIANVYQIGYNAGYKEATKGKPKREKIDIKEISHTLDNFVDQGRVRQ